MIAISERRRKNQGGFALLLVFALAAAIAINLYLELPRAAFESQRAKEQLVVERGKEYIRGIKLFVRKNRRFPATMDELEKFQDRRYLRQRYKDPLTGSDEWRVINIDNAGMLTNSKVQPSQQQGKQYNNTFISEGPGLAQQSSTGGVNQGVNLANRRRASDGQVVAANDQQGGPVDPNTIAQGGGFQAQANAQSNAQQPPKPVDPNAPPQTGVAVPGQQPQAQPPQPPPPQRYDLLGNALPPPPGATAPQQPQQPQPQAQPQPQQQFQPQQPGAPGNTAAPPMFPQNAVGQQGRAPGSAPGTNAATNLIQQMLTSPRPMPGAAMQGAGQIGGGIAGVASKYEGDSIMVYNERQRYDEWEFIYDMKKDQANNPVDRALQGAAQGAQEIDPQTGKPRVPAQGGLGGNPGGGINNNSGGLGGGGFGSGGFGSGGSNNPAGGRPNSTGPRR